MAFHPVPYCTECAIKGHKNGDPRITVLHYRRNTVVGRPNAAALAILAQRVAERVLTAMVPAVAAGTTWQEVVCTDIEDANGQRGVYSIAISLPAPRGGDAVPGNVAAVLAKKTSVAQARGRGRMFMMDLSEGDVSSSTFGTGYLGLLTTIAGRMMEVLNDTVQNWRPCVASKKHVTFADLQAVTFDNKADSLYTRLEGKRRHRRRPATPTVP